MKILKEKSRTYKEQEYYKYKVNIPLVTMDICGFKEGDELEVIPSHNTLTLRKKQKID